jgi:hypothetical protein
MIAPTEELGANGMLWTQDGGNFQTLLIDRNLFTEPQLVLKRFR